MAKSNNTNLAGEFYAMSRLFLEGLEPTLTLGNTKGVDILLLNPKNNKQFKVEVKTTKNRIGNSPSWGGQHFHWYPLKKEHEDCAEENLVFCFVNLSDEKNPRLFLIHSNIVQEYIRWESNYWVKEMKHKKEISPGDNRTFRLYVNKDDVGSLKIKKLLTKDFENNFSIFD